MCVGRTSQPFRGSAHGGLRGWVMSVAWDDCASVSCTWTTEKPCGHLKHLQTTSPAASERKSRDAWLGRRRKEKCHPHRMERQQEGGDLHTRLPTRCPNAPNAGAAVKSATRTWDPRVVGLLGEPPILTRGWGSVETRRLEAAVLGVRPSDKTPCTGLGREPLTQREAVRRLDS